MSKNILLLEPGYKNKYPPLGLMKIASYHNEKGDNVTFYKGKLPIDKWNKKWDRIYITTLFTFEWEKTIETINHAKNELHINKQNIFIGGIAASLMSKEIKEETGIEPITGLLNESNREGKKKIGYDDDCIIDDYTPDYSILEQDIGYKYSYNDAYFAYMTRGCGKNCDFCAVDTLEPEYKSYIDIKKQLYEINEKYGKKKDLLLMDNNVLRSPSFDKIVDDIIKLGYGKEEVYKKEGKYQKREMGHVDFNQGLDADILASNEEKVKLLGKLNIKPARIAFDHIKDEVKYKKAIKMCAKNGIKSFSNYMLYNYQPTKGDGNKYNADTPEELYERIQITLDLQEEINKSRSNNEKIAIYSFPMKYIPLGDKDRSYVSRGYWNKKYLRAIQVMLLPSHGIGGVSEEFFRKAFGKNKKDFMLNIKMPESILMSRGKFLQRDDERDEEWEKRLNNDKEALIKHKYYLEWKRLYKNIENKKAFINIIEDNCFIYEKYFNIKEDKIKKILLHYISSNQFLLLLNKVIINRLKEEEKLLYQYILNEFDLYYKKLIEYISQKEVSSKKLWGFLKVFKKKGLKSILKKWVNHYFENEQILDSLRKAMRHNNEIIIDMNKLRAIKCYINSGCFNNKEIDYIKNCIKNLDENEIIKIIKNNYNKFKNKLKKKNKNEPNYKKIEKEIDILTSKLGTQLCLFEEGELH